MLGSNFDTLYQATLQIIENYNENHPAKQPLLLQQSDKNIS